MVQHTENDFNAEYDLEASYLSKVYSNMIESQKEWSDFIETARTEGLRTVQKMSEDIKLNFSSYADNVDTFATIEMKNREIDQMNSRIQSTEILLKNVQRSLQSPYFGKVNVDFLDGERAENFYIGINSYTNQAEEKLVYDWRSPIAELFYNNELGNSSYEVNRNTINVNIDNRRQFVIEKDKLVRYFDTSVAIQDDVLLEALEQDSSNLLQDITATIQSEQNVIIRDTKHPILLVNGVAGSGKTSTIMQRIAYLLYTYKNKITSDNFMILSPNEHFVEYISNVLPSLGEQTPLNLTFRQFLSNHLMFDIENEQQYFERISLEDTSEQIEILRSEDFLQFVEQSEDRLTNQLDFFEPIYRKDKRMISTKRIIATFNETPSSSSLIQRIQATKQLLLTQWEERMVKMSNNPKVIDRILSLPEDLQYRFFGERITEDSQEALKGYALRYIRIQYSMVKRSILSMNWINISKLFEQLYQAYTERDYIFNESSFYNVDEAVVILYMYNQFIDKIAMPQMKFILIDEVQDYNSAQILLLNKLFPRSQFTMVGDENQAIFNSNIKFDTILKHFQKRPVKAQLYHLVNSYRSSGAVTKFFSQLAANNDQWEIVPIRPDGNIPSIKQTDTTQDLVQFIKEIQEQIQQQKLTIITKTDEQASEFRQQIGEEYLQSLHCEILPISLSKGLEFDHVLIHQVSEENYQNQRDQRILYTAASRAMKNLYISYSGAVSPLISGTAVETVNQSN